jgi:predicted lipoprotein with Yx(FWY)xxD motif
MRQLTKFLPALSATLLLAACGSSSGGSATSSAGAGVVRTATNSALGATVLVDAKGLTLYHLSGEEHGKWICASPACLQAWHPLTATGGAAPTGTVGSLGTTTRPDGTAQVTYRGTPLYTFLADAKPGEAKGEGIKDVGVWSAVTTSRAARTTPAATATAPAPASRGSSYGY